MARSFNEVNDCPEKNCFPLSLVEIFDTVFTEPYQLLLLPIPASVSSWLANKLSHLVKHVCSAFIKLKVLFLSLLSILKMPFEPIQ